MGAFKFRGVLTLCGTSMHYSGVPALHITDVTLSYDQKIAAVQELRLKVLNCRDDKTENFVEDGRLKYDIIRTQQQLTTAPVPH